MPVVNTIEAAYGKVFLAIEGVSIEAGRAWPLCLGQWRGARAPRWSSHPLKFFQGLRGQAW
jgi:hypothetical protein